MSDVLLDYSSWSFQLIVLLLASTAFYIAVRLFDSMPDGSSTLNTEAPVETPTPSQP